MNDKLDKIGETKLSTNFKNPFNKNSIESISVSFRKRMFDLGWIAEGSVRFKNGKTEGRQDFEGDSFDEVTQKIKYFIENEL